MRSIAWAAALSLLAGTAQAEFSIRTELDAAKIGAQDNVQLTITLSGTSLPNDVPMPALTNLRVAAGPMTSTQVSFVNGAVSHGRTYTFVLQPQAPGKAEVGAIRLKVEGVDHVAPAIGLEVVAGSVRPRGSAAAPQDPWDAFGGEDPFESMFRRGRRTTEPKLFFDATLNRTRVHVGEPVLLTYYLYTQTTVTDMRFSEPPKYAGFWSEELEKPQAPSGGERVALNGEMFSRFALMQKLLFPTKAGTVTIPATTLKIGIPRGFFDPTTGASSVERASKPMTITVEPIPEEADFSGAVGRFTASATLDKTRVGLGEAALLRFEVQGTGNLKWIDRGPEVKIPGAKVYPPQIKSELRASPGGISGTKTWEFVVIPETSGTLQVPALTFTYFDPETRQLARATTTALGAQVEGGTAASSAGGAPTGAAARASGPMPLRSDLDLPKVALPQLSTRALTGSVALLLLAHAALWSAPWLLQRRGSSSPRPARGRDVRRALSDLERVGRDGMSKEASVSLIEKALHEVFGSLDEDSVTAEDDRERAARKVLQEVYFIRYAPQLGDYSDQIREVARRAAEVVRKWA
jgi:hypothetical protein